MTEMQNSMLWAYTCQEATTNITKTITIIATGVLYFVKFWIIQFHFCDVYWEK